KKPQTPEAVARASAALSVVSSLASRVPTFIQHSHLETEEAWRAYWSPVFRCLSTQCVNPCREIRSKAFGLLQRCLQSPQLASTDHKEWTNIFGEVLFPLINQLLKPEVYQTDPGGMSETRVHAAQLLCKIFLHYLDLLKEWDGESELWTSILDIMDRFMNSGQNDTLVEAVPESLKNVLLVMSSGGHLVPPSEKPDDQTPQQRKIWTETWTRLERFLPGLMPELFPGAQKEATPAPAGAAAPAATAAPSDNNVAENGETEAASPTTSEPAAATNETKDT
ncbi:Sec7-domain-containing protein, partial [Hortaea werneckii]